MATALELKCPSCGREYPSHTNGPHFFAKHVATCKGPQATVSPRAKPDAHRADPPRRKSARRTSVPRKKKRDYKAERVRRKQRAGGGAIRRKQRVENGSARQVMGPAVTPAAFIAALEAEKAKIDEAIAAVRRLA